MTNTTKYTGESDKTEPHNTHSLIAIGGSAGSFPIIKDILLRLPEDYPSPLAIVLHRIREGGNDTAGTLQYKSKLTVLDAVDKMIPKPGMVIIAPANYHMLLEVDGSISLDCSAPVNFSRPSIDVFFDSAAHALKENLTAIVLSGANADGSEGIKTVKKFGGYAIIQNPETAEFNAMPTAALKAIEADLILDANEIVHFLLRLKTH